MTNDEIATEHAQSLLRDEIAYHTKERPEKLARLSAEERSELESKYIAKQKEIALKTLESFASTDGLLKMHRIGTLHPSNKNTRKMFERWSGKTLPKSATATETWLKDFIGPDVVDKYYADLDAEAKADADAAAKAAAEIALQRLNRLSDDVANDRPVDGDALVDLAAWLGISLHPRTIGTIRSRVKAIQNGKGVQIGRGFWPDSVWQAYNAVRNSIMSKKAS